MTGLGDGGRKHRRATWESWVEQQIRIGMERGEFENLPGRGKPLAGIAPDVEIPHDEDWWLKAKLRRERLSYLPPRWRYARNWRKRARRSLVLRTNMSCAGSSATSINGFAK